MAMMGHAITAQGVSRCLQAGGQRSSQGRQDVVAFRLDDRIINLGEQLLHVAHHSGPFSLIVAQMRLMRSLISSPGGDLAVVPGSVCTQG